MPCRELVTSQPGWFIANQWTPEQGQHVAHRSSSVVLGGSFQVNILDLSLTDASYVQFTATVTDGTYGVLVGSVAIWAWSWVSWPSQAVSELADSHLSSRLQHYNSAIEVHNGSLS